MRIKKLSNTQIGTWEWCPYKWKLERVDRCKIPRAQPLSAGVAFHSAIETFLRDVWMGANQEIAEANALSHFDYVYVFDEKRDDLGTICPSSSSMPYRMLRNTFASIRDYDFTVLPKNEGSDLLWLETFCERRLSPQLMFLGKIDCLAMVDDRRTIVDWKTSKEAWTSVKVARNKGQLTAYAWMLEGQWDQLAYVVAAKDTGEVQWHVTERSAEQIEQWKQSVLDIHRKMEGTTQFPKQLNWKCDYCGYQPIYCQGNGGF